MANGRRRASGIGVSSKQQNGSCMVRWHENEATLSRKLLASVTGGVQGNGEGRGKCRRETKVDESRKEMADSEARYQDG